MRIPKREYWEEYEHEKQLLGVMRSDEYERAIREVTKRLDERGELFEELECEDE